MFVGCPEYKSTFILDLQRPFTLIRYKQDSFLRLRFTLKSYYIALIIGWFCFGAIYLIYTEWIRFLFGLAFVITSGYIAIIKQQRILARSILIISELILQIKFHSLI